MIRLILMVVLGIMALSYAENHGLVQRGQYLKAIPRFSSNAMQGIGQGIKQASSFTAHIASRTL